VLDGARGAIVVDEDEASFAAAVAKLLRDPGLQAELGAEARAFVASRWSSRVMAERLLRLYSGVAARAPAREPIIRTVA
jgi:glycosyltransferase involved in cell wall biosynthesis